MQLAKTLTKKKEGPKHLLGCSKDSKNYLFLRLPPLTNLNKFHSNVVGMS